MRVGTEWWSLEIAPGWSGQDDEECFTLTRSENGAFQLSAARRESAPITPAEIDDRSRTDCSRFGQPFGVRFADFEGYGVTYFEGELAWRRYWLYQGRLVVFVTYVCTVEPHVSEWADVETMLGSLRSENGAA